MVRIYCLSSINRIPPQEFKVKSYENGSVEEWDLKENQDSETPKNLLAQRYLYEFYRLTEICIGHQYVESRKVYAINIFRKDCNLLTFKMVRGAVKLNKLAPDIFDLFIASSALFPNSKIDFDLRIRIRCIKNTKVKGIISPEEEKIYEEFAEKLFQFCSKSDDASFTVFPTVREAAFGVIPFILPNTTNESALRTKISIFIRLIHLLCDPETGSYQNILLYTLEKNKGKEITSQKDKNETLDQKLACLLYNRIIWKAKAPRKAALDSQSINYHGCKTLQWINAKLSNLKPTNLDAENLLGIQFFNVQIFDSKKALHNFFLSNTFKSLTVVELISCFLTELTDDFFNFIPPTLERLIVKKNNITKISKKIWKLENLKELNLDDNKNLEDDGIPWEMLPRKIIKLYLTHTNLTKIPDEIRVLFNSLQKIYVHSPKLEYFAWNQLGSMIDEIFVSAGKKLNAFDISEKHRISDLTINNAGLTYIDCLKLQKAFSSTSLVHYGDGEFGAPLHSLMLNHNALESIEWELLPGSLNCLSLAGNKLKKIGNISHLTNLSMLSLSSNKISAISKEIFGMRILTNLDLEDNFLTELPAGFEDGFQSLVHLNLSDNNFNHTEKNLEEVLWNRLPRGLTTLEINDNNLGKIPCSLRESQITKLYVNGCHLTHICPFLYSKNPKLKELQILKNPELTSLPFIPKTIYQPPIYSDNNIRERPSGDFIVICDIKDESFIVTKAFPQKFNKPIYEFEKCNDNDVLECECCAECGKETEENAIEQVMVMDYGMRLKIEKEEEAMETVQEKSDNKNFAFRINNYSAGKWKSTVKTRICAECLGILKQKIEQSYKEHKNSSLIQESTPLKKPRNSDSNVPDVSQPPQNSIIPKSDDDIIIDSESTSDAESNAPKYEYIDSLKWEILYFPKSEKHPLGKFGTFSSSVKHYDDTHFKADEIAVTKSIHNLNFSTVTNPNCLILKNFGGIDCFLIAAVNAIESMDSLKESICEKQNPRNIGKTQKELIKVLKGESKNVKNLRKTLSAFTSNEQEDAASALIKLIEALDKKSKNLIFYSYDTVESCLCVPKICRHTNDCITLHLNAECQNTTFDSMLQNWQKSNSHHCAHCNTTKVTENFVTLGESQKFLIIELNAMINGGPEGELIPCSILAENGNLEKQLIFGALWELTAALQYLGDGKEGHYRTWKKAKNGWTVINDNQNWHKSELLPDLKEYRVLVFKKLVVELIPLNNVNDEGNDAILHQGPPETQPTPQYQAQTIFNDNFNQPNPYQLPPIQYIYQNPNPDNWNYSNHIPQQSYTYFQPQQSGTFTDLSSNTFHTPDPHISQPYLLQPANHVYSQNYEDYDAMVDNEWNQNL